MQNPVGLKGMEFLEYTSAQPAELAQLFERMGFQKVAQQKDKKVSLYRQGEINFLLNEDPGSFAEGFHKEHGPSICSSGFRVENSAKAFATAVERGARPYKGTVTDTSGKEWPAIYGIGDSLIYFVEEGSLEDTYANFEWTGPKEVVGNGFKLVDHMTNNVPKGEMQKWCDFYENIFNFKEKRYFDIKGNQTGLVSKVMKSPCGGIVIPINEPTENKSQIQEYLDEYKGSGIQHVALLTDNIVETMAEMRQKDLEFLHTPDTYYDSVKTRVPHVTEDIDKLKDLRILVDGDPEGYLLQIFTKNVIGPIFFEVIQRKQHYGFGEGNFQALFDAIEADQRQRGYL